MDIREFALVREALVREIIDAERWSAVLEAWQALLKVKAMQKEHMPDKIQNGTGCNLTHC